MPIQQFNVLPRWLDGIPPKSAYKLWEVELDCGKVIYSMRLKAFDRIDAQIKAQDYMKAMNEIGKRGLSLNAPPGVPIKDGEFYGHSIKFRQHLVITLDIRPVR